VTPATMDRNDLSGSYGSMKSLWAVGFGNQNPHGNQFPDRLHHVEVKYVPQAVCDNNYSGGITSNMMCAAGKYIYKVVMKIHCLKKTTKLTQNILKTQTKIVVRVIAVVHCMTMKTMYSWE